MKAVSAFCLSLFLFTFGSARVGAAPSLVYTSTFLGGIWDVAVDSAGSAYVLGYTGPPSYSYFVAKLSPAGELIFQHLLELPQRYPSAIAVDPAGSIYIAGHRNLIPEMGSEKDEAFVAKLSPDGTEVIYESTIWEGDSTQGLDLAVDALGQAYLYYRARNNYGDTFSTVASFSPAGSVSGWVGGRMQYATAMALGPSGDLFTVGWVYPVPGDYESRTQVHLYRTEAASGALIDTVVDDRSISSWSVDVAATPGNGSVVVAEGLYVTELGPTGEEIFFRVLDLGAVEILDVAVTSAGEIVVGAYTESGILVLRLEGGTGEVISSITFGRNVGAIAVGPGGDIYVAVGGRVSRFTENRPPDCSRAKASPSVIWPANGKMVPVSILGVTDPDGDPITVKITNVTQDEPGATFSGIGSPTAQVKAERDGKGDGRVYRIQLEATDPAGATCTGEVTVCVPHDRGKGSCVDGNR